MMTGAAVQCAKPAKPPAKRAKVVAATPVAAQDVWGATAATAATTATAATAATTATAATAATTATAAKAATTATAATAAFAPATATAATSATKATAATTATTAIAVYEVKPVEELAPTQLSLIEDASIQATASATGALLPGLIQAAGQGHTSAAVYASVPAAPRKKETFDLAEALSRLSDHSLV